MALGDPNYQIRIQVDQRLPLESGVVGAVRDDATVSTEITYFDRVGDSYILEGVLAFAGAVESNARESEDSGPYAVTPISYRLPFALRLPVEGQPNFLEVNTRIGKWDIQPVAPGLLQLRAELTIQGLNGKNGYAFYCGEQENWVQPQGLPAEKPLVGTADGLRGEVGDEQDKGYDEQEWMMEAKEERDEQDTIVYEPGSAWYEQLDSALQQESPVHREDYREYTPDYVTGNRSVDDYPEPVPIESDQEIRNQEDDYQFEALANEDVLANEGTASSLAQDHSSEPDFVMSESADEDQEQAVSDSVLKQDGAEITDVAEYGKQRPLAEVVPEPVSTGPKLSFGSKKNEEDSAPLKLSGLLYGSVTKNTGREEGKKPDPGAQFREEPAKTESGLQEQFISDETVERNEEDAYGSGEESGSSVWGKWIQKASETKFTLKFRIIQEAESLDQIATKYETPVESLMRANGLTNEQVNAGQVLIIPGRRR